jgi:hypothetical protein
MGGPGLEEVTLPLYALFGFPLVWVFEEDPGPCKGKLFYSI